MNRKDVMEEFPFPDIREGLAFFPEIVIFQEMGMKYKARYINPALRAYFKDQENSTTYKKRNRSKENIYLWQYYLNNALHYFFYSPIFFIKSFVGLSMDGFTLGMSVKEILALTNRWYKKAIVFYVCPWVIF